MLRFFLAKFPQNHRHLRCISSTSHLTASWMDRMKEILTGRKTTEDITGSAATESFTLVQFAEQMNKSFKKQEAIIRCLVGFDPSGDNIQVTQKRETAKQCNCTIADVEYVLAKFIWSKEAQRKIKKLKEEGKPLPKTTADVQKLMGSTPTDVARSNLAKSMN